MELYGEVKSLKVFVCRDYWNSANLFQIYEEDPVEIGIYIDEPCRQLIDYLINRSTLTNEPYSDKRKDKARLISLSELKLRLCIETKALKDKESGSSAAHAQCECIEQLDSLIRRINMIAELGEIKGEDLFLRFCIV